MSFLNLKDPSKRDALVAEFIKTKNEIQNDFRSERLGEQSLYQDFGKIVKPITGQQKKLSEEIVSKFAPLQEAIENMPPALPSGQVEGQPEAFPAPDDEPPTEIYDPVASKYLRVFATPDADKRCGLKDRNGQLYLGNSKFDIVGDNMKIGDIEYRGREGLWHLLMKDEPKINFATDEDLENYGEMLIRTNAVRHLTSTKIKPLENKSYKWQNIIKAIWN